MTDISQGLYTFMLAIVPAMFGIICHEVAHGWAAYKQGDPTAKMLGRLTLNPVKHIDPVGLGVFAFTALMPNSPFIFGWAKPVPVQSAYFRSPRKAMLLVSLAGPMANFLVALLCALLLKLTVNLSTAGVVDPYGIAALVRKSLGMGIGINCALAWFNLLPVPPLDGSHILGGLLPRSLSMQYAKISRFGLLIVILLLATGFLGRILVPLIQTSVAVIGAITGLRLVM